MWDSVAINPFYSEFVCTAIVFGFMQRLKCGVKRVGSEVQRGPTTVPPTQPYISELGATEVRPGIFNVLSHVVPSCANNVTLLAVQAVDDRTAPPS